MHHPQSPENRLLVRRRYCRLSALFDKIHSRPSPGHLPLDAERTFVRFIVFHHPRARAGFHGMRGGASPPDALVRALVSRHASRVVHRPRTTVSRVNFASLSTARVLDARARRLTPRPKVSPRAPRTARRSSTTDDDDEHRALAGTTTRPTRTTTTTPRLSARATRERADDGDRPSARLGEART